MKNEIKKHEFVIDCNCKLNWKKTINDLRNELNEIDMRKELYVIRDQQRILSDRLSKIESNMPIFSRFYGWLQEKGLIRNLGE